VLIIVYSGVLSLAQVKLCCGVMIGCTPLCYAVGR
jgi:hypothetical protein